MDNNPDEEDQPRRRRRLVLTREQFDDYWIALLARIRYNDEADRIVSGITTHPLQNYQMVNSQALQILAILPFTLRQLVEDVVPSLT